MLKFTLKTVIFCLAALSTHGINSMDHLKVPRAGERRSMSLRAAGMSIMKTDKPKAAAPSKESLVAAAASASPFTAQTTGIAYTVDQLRERFTNSPNRDLSLRLGYLRTLGKECKMAQNRLALTVRDDLKEKVACLARSVENNIDATLLLINEEQKEKRRRKRKEQAVKMAYNDLVKNRLAARALQTSPVAVGDAYQNTTGKLRAPVLNLNSQAALAVARENFERIRPAQVPAQQPPAVVAAAAAPQSPPPVQQRYRRLSASMLMPATGTSVTTASSSSLITSAAPSTMLSKRSRDRAAARATAHANSSSSSSSSAAAAAAAKK